MTTLAWILLAAGITGGSIGGFYVGKGARDSQEPVIVEPVIIDNDDEIGEELVKKEAPMCEAEYVSQNGTGDCFEWICLTRDDLALAACESISNANTSKRIRQDCQKETEEQEKKDCYSWYKERK